MPITCTRPDSGIALITISNPGRRNALGVTEFTELALLWDELEADRTLRCAVVTGEGTVAFCSGAQMDADFSVVGDIGAMVDKALLKTRVFPKPIVAAVNGHCVAGGFELMLSSDLRVASDSARLGLPEVRWGIVPSGGGAMKLIEQIGQARALQLLLTGELVSAQTALAYGLVNEVVPAGEVIPQALRLASVIAANSPLAVMHTKRLALELQQARWQEKEHAERVSAKTVRQSEDCRLGRTAFATKTSPTYRSLPD